MFLLRNLQNEIPWPHPCSEVGWDFKGVAPDIPRTHNLTENSIFLWLLQFFRHFFTVLPEPWVKELYCIWILCDSSPQLWILVGCHFYMKIISNASILKNFYSLKWDKKFNTKIIWECWCKLEDDLMKPYED